MKALYLAALAGFAAAACPNKCSGHGTCDNNDICSCFGNWMGADCSQRKCEVDRAWAADDATNAHAYAECAGQGVCNRASGECECFEGFTGRACARSACPADCSGHGVCKLLSEINTSVAYNAATNWDAKRIQSCECDAGYFGPDCSLRSCPTGDDPLTICKSNVKNQVQEIRFVLGSTSVNAAGTKASTEAMAVFGSIDATGANADAKNVAALAKGQMRVSYTDSWGGVWTGHGVDAFPSAANDAAKSLEIALESLPNNKVNDVLVSSTRQSILKADGQVQTGGADIPQTVWQVTFQADTKNSNNVGLQRALQCDTGYSCTEAGCQPMVQMPFLYRYANVPAKVVGTSVANVKSLDSGANTDIHFFAGSATDTITVAQDSVTQFIRLNAKSQPQMPMGYSVDKSASAAGNTNFARYDMRVLVAVVDGKLDDGVDNADSYYTRVILGDTNISSSTEAVGKWVTATTAANVWTSTATNGAWQYSLDGFTFNGAIPSTFTNVPVAGAPGVFIDFPSANMVSDQKIQFFEILVKLPHCTVTPNVAANDVHDLTTFANFVPTVDSEVENIECSGRGQCDRKTGQCGCFEGYYGIACQTQTTLV